jgi:hypothetical protein
MKLYEFEGKSLFRKAGIPTPDGITVRNGDQEMSGLDKLCFPLAVKSQVLRGGRGKAGGIKFAETREDLISSVNELFAMDIGGEKVTKILVEEKLSIDSEFYAGITFDPKELTPLLIISDQGGVDIEQVASSDPDKVIQYHIDPIDPPKFFDLMNLVSQSKPESVFATGSMAVNFLHFEYDNEKSDILDNGFVIVTYENGIRANFNLCMFSPMFYHEVILCGDEGRIKASEYEDFLSGPRVKSHMEIMCGENKPARKTMPSYAPHIEETGHNGATYFEHVYFMDNIEGKETSTATAEEGFWSIVVGAAAEESVKSGGVVNIDEFLKKNDIDI